jgi:hypothetical protein
VSSDWVKHFDAEAEAAMDASVAKYEHEKLLLQQPITGESAELTNLENKGRATTQANPTQLPGEQSATQKLACSEGVDGASSSNPAPSTIKPSPPAMMPEPPLHPYGSPFQPVRFSDGTIAMVPITKTQGRPNHSVYNYIKRTSEEYHVADGLYELTLAEQLSFLPNAIGSLRNFNPVIVRRLPAPRDVFSLEILTTTYKLSPHTPVNMHGK